MDGVTLRTARAKPISSCGFRSEAEPNVLRYESDETGRVTRGSRGPIGTANVDGAGLNAVVEVLEQPAHAVQQAGFA